MKDRPDSSPEVHPIGWKMSLVTKVKAADFFSRHQFRVACSPGGEKVVHGLRECIEDHWEEEEFVFSNLT